jgi:ABC-type branched-subunit amino acid transport system substrate-binding protein
MLTGFAGELRADIKVGAVLPLSGPAAATGASQWLGLSIAIKEINGNPSKVGRLSLQIEDDGGQPPKAAEQVFKLIHMDRIEYIVGLPLASSANAIQKAADQAGVLFISTGGINSIPESRSEAASLRFHIGSNLGDLAKIKDGVANSTTSKAAPNSCYLGQSPTFSDDDDFAICPFAFSDRAQWNGFLSKVREETHNNETSANLDAAIAYVALKMLYAAMEIADPNPAQITPKKTAAVLRDQTFTTLFGKKSFGKAQAILTTPLLVLNPSKSVNNRLPPLLSKSAAESKDKCEDCKKTDDCPQGLTSQVLSKDDCCKKTNDCPQGVILRDN